MLEHKNMKNIVTLQKKAWYVSFFIGLFLCIGYLHAKLDIMFDEERQRSADVPPTVKQQSQPPIPATQQPAPIIPKAGNITPATQQEFPPIPASQQPLPLPQPPSEIVYKAPLVQEKRVVPFIAQETETSEFMDLQNPGMPEQAVQAVIQQPQQQPEPLSLGKEVANIQSQLPVRHPAEMIPAGSSVPEKPSKKSKKKKDDPLISFDFKNEKLVNVINLFAAKKGINIILPQGNDAIKTTISFAQNKKIPLSQAEKYVYFFLELSGYTMYPTDGFSVISKKADNTEGREPLNLYVSVPPDELPQSSENIRAIYYLTNFQVPATTQGTEPIRSILAEMVGAKKFMFDQKSNAIILMGPADKIASAMTIILELDAAGSPEVVEVFPLFYTNADTIAKLVQGQISAVVKPTTQGVGRVQTGESSNYFAPNTRAIADLRTNSLILIGTEAAVSRIKSFVREYIDVPAESGDSILHIYDLQYLDARDFAKVLNQILKPTGAAGQSEKEPGGGPQRFFESVIVVAEEIVTEEAVREVSGAGTSAVKGAAGKVTLGGNRIIFTAKRDDAVVIKNLIEQLDKPELQVIVEIMILDVTLQGDKSIASQTRNPLTVDIHNDEKVQFQSAQITTPILDPDNTNPTTLAADLLRLLGVNPNTSIAVPETSGPNSGTTIVSFKDPCTNGIWSILAILDKWITTNIISHPFLVTKNNVKAKERLATIRQALGREVASGGVATVKIEDFTATISVEVTPRISSLDRLNLQIRVDIDNFLTTNVTGAAVDFTRATRSVETNATLSTGQVLILGGLTKETDVEIESKVPILGDIPILGYFFKSVSKEKIKNNLAIFVHPTIVEPKLRSGQNKYTADRIQTEKTRLETESLFSSQRDPITRMFFNNMGKTGPDELNDYLKSTHYGEEHREGIYQPAVLTGQAAQETAAEHMTATT